MRIVFTGGSGKAGKHVIPELLAHGHSVLNVDLVPLDVPGVDNVRADITDESQVFNAFSMLHNLGELDSRAGASPLPDAVVHFAAIPRILLRPDNEAYRINTMGTYNVLEVALKLGIRKVIFASSETTYGVCFADGERKPEYLPIDEEHPVVPEDSCTPPPAPVAPRSLRFLTCALRLAADATSKVCNEVTARCFQRRTGADISTGSGSTTSSSRTSTRRTSRATSPTRRAAGATSSRAPQRRGSNKRPSTSGERREVAWPLLLLTSRASCALFSPPAGAQVH